MKRVIHLKFPTEDADRLEAIAHQHGTHVGRYLQSLLAPIANPANEGMTFYVIGLDDATNAKLLEHAQVTEDDDVEGILDVIVNQAVRDRLCSR